MEQEQDNAVNLDGIIDDSVYYRTYFKKDPDYYYTRYEKLLNGASVVFNPYAFFLGLFWMAYRKMYLELVILVLGIGLVDVIVLFVLDIDSASIDRFMNLMWAVLMGCYANVFYMKKARRVVEVAKENYADEAGRLDYLEREGGVSFIGPLAVGILLVIFVVGMFVLAGYVDDIYY